MSERTHRFIVSGCVFLFCFTIFIIHLTTNSFTSAPRDAAAFGSLPDSSRQVYIRTDFASFYYAAKGVTRSGNIYDARYLNSLAENDRVANHVLPYLYPPFFAIGAQPLAALSPQTAERVWDFIQVLVLSLTAVIIFFIAVSANEKRMNQWRAAGIIGATCIILPFFSNIDFGQINFLVLFFISLSFFFYFSTQYDWLAGVFLCLSMLIKVTPALFLIFFLVDVRKKAILGFFSGLIIFLSVSLLFGASGLWVRFIQFLPDMGYARNVNGGFHPSIIANISLAGFYMRAFATGITFVRLLTICTVVGLLATTLYSHLKSRSRETDIFFILPYSVLMVIASPVAWRHHLIYLFPGVVLVLANVVKDKRQRTMTLLLSTTIILASFDFQSWYAAITIPEEIRPYVTSMNLFFLIVLFFLALHIARRTDSLLVKT